MYICIAEKVSGSTKVRNKDDIARKLNDKVIIGVRIPIL